MNFKNLIFAIAMIATVSVLSSCQKDDDINPTNTNSTGSAQFEITDAPIDNAQVSGAFVTITEIKVDGTSIEGFNKTTIDLLAYQNGDTKLLGDAQLDAKAYSEITLVLDYEQDANGNSPGCYVQEANDSKKHELKSSSSEIKMNYNLLVEEGEQAKVLFDFDLRKSIKKQDDMDDQYDFVSQAELNNSVRVVAKNETGVIKGACNDNTSNSDKIVVYAYKKGDYDRDQEVKGQGQSNIEFANAVSSSSVDANGNFELHFLEEGDYELEYASYEENSEGEMELKGTLMIDILSSININSVSVEANATFNVEVDVIGVFGL